MKTIALMFNNHQQTGTVEEMSVVEPAMYAGRLFSGLNQ